MRPCSRGIRGKPRPLRNRSRPVPPAPRPAHWIQPKRSTQVIGGGGRWNPVRAAERDRWRRRAHSPPLALQSADAETPGLPLLRQSPPVIPCVSNRFRRSLGSTASVGFVYNLTRGSPPNYRFRFFSSTLYRATCVTLATSRAPIGTNPAYVETALGSHATSTLLAPSAA